jgi:ribonuclease PH
MDGRLTKEEFERGLKLAMSACHQIYELQRTALIDRYSESVGGGE